MLAYLDLSQPSALQELQSPIECFKVSACSTLGVYTLFYCKHGFRRVCIIFEVHFYCDVLIIILKLNFLLKDSSSC